jgi:hypothetical protein
MSLDLSQPLIQKLIESCPEGLNLNVEGDLVRTLKVAEEVLAEIDDRAQLDILEAELAKKKDEVPLTVHLALKLARSRLAVKALPENYHVTVVFAVYKENNRVKTQAEHPHGEDFLRRKLAQLHWLCDADSKVSWDLIVVDDGCPEGSGKIIADLAAQQPESSQIKVMFLQDAIDEGLPVAKALTSTADSQKGGSIHYGMWSAAQRKLKNHVLVFTDADLSTHLGQVGLLLEQIAAGNHAAIGSRRETTSVVVKQGIRNTRGKLFIYLWKRLFPELNYIVDTQCGFKAFRADTLAEIVEGTIEKKFAFDIELLLKIQLRHPGAIAKVPIAWIDSEAASTTTQARPYRPMLVSLVDIYRKYLPTAPEAEEFAAFIKSLDPERWDRLSQHIPDQIADRDPAEFGEFDGVTAAELANLAAEG